MVAQNVLVNGKVLNSSNGTALPYAHIMFENFRLGTSANENGNFRFSIPDSLNGETLIISHVGFNSAKLSINDLLKKKEVSLVPKTEGLNEVSIVQVLKDRAYVYRPEQFLESVGIGNMNAALFPSTIARYYPKPDKFPEECFLEYVQIYFYPVQEQENLSPKFRFHIYNVQKNGLPGEDILENMVLEKKPGEKSMKVELLNKKIQIPENGFYVGLEHLFIKENEYTEVKNYYINDSLVAENFPYKRYAPVYKGVFAEPSEDLKVYYYQPGGWVNISNWEISKRNLENNYITPVFKIKITD